MFGDPIEYRRLISSPRLGDYVLEQQATLPEGTRDGLRVGIAFTRAEGFEHCGGIGLGSWENYPDRASNALLGRWESTIDALAVPYILQQENGTCGGVDSLLLSGPRGRVEVSPREPLFLNLSRHTVEQLGNADAGRADPAHRNRRSRRIPRSHQARVDTTCHSSHIGSRSWGGWRVDPVHIA